MSKTILIVEDNELNMKLFHDLLEAHNYQTLQTRDGSDALALAREHMPDLILMDINLPGIDGFEALQLLKQNKNTQNIPVIALTADVLRQDVKKGLKAGFHGFLAKPIKIDDFLLTIHSVLNTAE